MNKSFRGFLKAAFLPPSLWDDAIVWAARARSMRPANLRRAARERKKLVGLGTPTSTPPAEGAPAT